MPSPFWAPLRNRSRTATSPDQAAAAFHAATRRGTAVTVAVVATAVTLTLVTPGLWDRAGTTVLVVGLLVGVPHGAVDHLLPLYRHAVKVSMLPALALGYALVAALSWAAITVFRSAGLVLFMVLSAVHFGTGERTFARIRGRGRALPGRWSGWVGLGAAVVVLPITCHPGQVVPYLRSFAPGVGWQLPQPLAAGATLVVLAGMATLVLSHLRAAAYLPATETALLVTMMTLAPPAVALGVYFGGWHSVRHAAILLAENPLNHQDLSRGHFTRPLRRFAVAAALPTGAAMAVIGLTWFAGAHGDLHWFIAHDLTILAALTVPHAAAVWWLDHTRPHPGKQRPPPS